jgi:hypothetical protein
LAETLRQPPHPSRSHFCKTYFAWRRNPRKEHGKVTGRALCKGGVWVYSDELIPSFSGANVMRISLQRFGFGAVMAFTFLVAGLPAFAAGALGSSSAGTAAGASGGAGTSAATTGNAGATENTGNNANSTNAGYGANGTAAGPGANGTTAGYGANGTAAAPSALPGATNNNIGANGSTSPTGSMTAP